MAKVLFALVDSRLADDTPGDVFSQSERPYLTEKPKV